MVRILGRGITLIHPYSRNKFNVLKNNDKEYGNEIEITSAFNTSNFIRRFEAEKRGSKSHSFLE